MNYKYLLRAGRAHLEKYPGCESVSNPGALFPEGARWMYDRLNELHGKDSRPFDPKVNYNLYGYLKYGICLCGFFLAIGWFWTYGFPFIPLAILIFYLLEVQFLFLFPLLIDQSKKPMLTGLREVFKIGIVKCLCTVIPISIFMMMGLFRKGDRVRNWYIGCLAILIWYDNDVRTRI